MLELTENELSEIKDTLNQFYQKDVEISLAHSDMALGEDENDLTTCPTVFWYEFGANFLVIKTSESTYQGQFFYTPHDQYHTPLESYQALGECVSAVLDAQFEHDR